MASDRLDEQQDLNFQDAIAVSIENTASGAEAQAARVATRERIDEQVRRELEAESRREALGGLGGGGAYDPLAQSFDDPEAVAKVMDIPKGAVAGVLNTVESIKNLGIDLVGATDTSGYIDPKVLDIMREKISVKDIIPEAKTAAGNVAESITQFAAAFLPINQASRATGIAKAAAKVPKTIKVAAQEAAATFIGFEERMALTENLVKAVDPELAKKLPDYLKEDAEDSPFETRFVNALEATGVMLAGNFVLKGLRSVRDMARVNQARTVVEKTVKPVQEKMAKVRTRLEKLAKEQAQPLEAVQRLKKAVEEPLKETKTRKELAEAANLLGVTVEDLKSRDAYKAAKELKVDEQIAAVTVIQDNQYQEMTKAFTDLESLVKDGCGGGGRLYEDSAYCARRSLRGRSGGAVSSQERKCDVVQFRAGASGGGETYYRRRD